MEDVDFGGKSAMLSKRSHNCCKVRQKKTQLLQS